MAHPKDDPRPLWERDPERYREKTRERIKKLSVEDPETGCWIWTGQTRRNVHRPNAEGQKRPFVGYKDRKPYAYRVAYELWVGPIPEGLEIDHAVCGNCRCVNPWHLEPVTHQENVKRYWERRRAEEHRLRLEARDSRRHPAYYQGAAK